MLNKPKNIILLTVDCWRADHFRRNGEAVSPTPFIDGLLHDTLVFEQAITCGGWTRPSITALLSSTHASMYGGPLGRYADQRPIVSEVLQNNGYDTAAFTTNPQVGISFGFERGFNTFRESEPVAALQGPNWARIKGSQRLLAAPLAQWALQPLHVNTLPAEVTAPAEQLVDQVAQWLLQPRTRPAFVWAHFMDMHWPYHLLRKPHSPTEKARIWKDLQIGYRIAEAHGYLHPGESQVARLWTLYRKALSYVDEQIGNLIQRLRYSGLWEDTVLILTADHGEEFYEHGRWSHYQLYDESLRVPLILRLPGLEQSQRIPDQVSLLDISPTILELAGLTPTQEMLGESLLGTTRGKPRIQREAYAEAMWPDTYRLAIRNEEYKYIYDSQDPENSRLFDLQADPQEKHNLYRQQPNVAKKFEELRRQHQNRATATAVEAEEGLAVNPALAERLRALGYVD